MPRDNIGIVNHRKMFIVDQTEKMILAYQFQNGGEAYNMEIFIGIFPTGISYADKTREENGDYKCLAFLSYNTLKLTIQPDCPDDLRTVIEANAKTIQSQRGEQFVISTCGQTVKLGR